MEDIEIAIEPCFLVAVLTDDPEPRLFGVARLLGVMRSVLVRWDDWPMIPVYDFLAAQCFEEISTTEEADERFMFGRVVHTVYRVYEDCPEEIREHNCREQRRMAP